MRVLLDENMPLDLDQLMPGFIVSHLETIGLKGTQNGELLAVARRDYDAFVTLDRGILHQHKHEGPLIIVVVRVPNSNGDTVRERSAELIKALTNSQPGDRFELPVAKLLNQDLR